MSYDIYCYKSKLGRPDLEEAQSLIENEMIEKIEGSHHERCKQDIVQALLSFNPRLEIFAFDYDEISKALKISLEDAKEKFSYIEINAVEGEIATQFTINYSSVNISIPYWYTGEKAKALFELLNKYLNVIYYASRFFVYDPQTEYVFNPTISNLNGLEVYDAMAEEVKEITESANFPKKPWWKLW